MQGRSSLAGGVLDPASAAGWRQVSMASLCQRRDGDGDGDEDGDGDGGEDGDEDMDGEGLRMGMRIGMIASVLHAVDAGAQDALLSPP